MRFTADRDVLVAALEQAGKAASSNGPVARLRGVRLEAREDGIVEAVATNMSEMAYTSAVASDIVPGVAVVADVRRVARSLRELPAGLVTLEASDSLDDGRLQLSSGSLRCLLPTHPVEDYPRLEAFAQLPQVASLPAAALHRCLAQVLPSAARDESRPVLAAVQVAIAGGFLTCAATDSYRLAVWREPVESTVEATMLVPSRLAELVLARIGKRPAGHVAVFCGQPEGRRGGRRVAFATCGVRLGGWQVEGQFPNWRQLVPDEMSVTVRLPRRELAEKVARLAKLTPERRCTPLRLGFEPGSEVAALSIDAGPDYAAVSDTLAGVQGDGFAEGEPFAVGVDPAFLGDGLAMFEGDMVWLGMISPRRPLLLGDVEVAERYGRFYLCMPVVVRS